MPFTFAGVRNVEFKYNLQAQPAIFYATGLLSQEEIEVNGVKVKPLDVVASLIKAPGDNIFDIDDAALEYADRTSFVELIVIVEGMRGGKRYRYTANCQKMNAPGPVLKRLYGTALVYGALPLAIGISILGDTDLDKGIIFADQLNPNAFIERMLGTGYPYRWKESAIEL